MYKEIQKYLPKARNNKQRIRTIFLNLRKLDKFFAYSDFVLLDSIVAGLISLNFPYSKKEIYSAFKEVDKNDYDPLIKRHLIADLVKYSCDKSVFN